MQDSTSSNSRRNFLKQSAVLAGSFAIIPRHVLGRGFLAPSDKLSLGFIGIGKQTRGLVNRFIQQTTAEVVAGCDVFESKRAWFEQYASEKYAEHRQVKDRKGIQTYASYESMLTRDDIDGIVVVTPDHWHAIPVIAAMKAGKDVYCEKPLAHTVREGRAMVKATQKYGKILQTGSMQRSNNNFRLACELVRNGYLGEIEKVLVNVGDPEIPYDLQAEEMPKGLDWDRWCGPHAVVAYHHTLAPPTVDTKFWPQWRAYTEFGGGILCDWGAHMFDIAQWGLGMDSSGPVKWIPPTDPKAVRGLKMVYANGIEMIHEDFGRGWGVRFIGSKGSLDVSRQYLDSKPDNIVSATIKDSETHLYDSKNHYIDWLDAVKKRSTPICDAETGHRSASVCNIANIAYHLNRPLDWNPDKEKFAGDGEANKLLTKKYRKPYKLKG